MPEMKIYLGHFFIYAITALGYYLYVSVYKKLPAHAGYVFGAIGMGKMIFSIIFLLPIIFKPYDGRVYFVLQFMTIYMVYLLIEVLTLLKNMKQNE